MSTAPATPSAAAQAAVDRIQKCFEALDRIAASREQTAGLRRQAELQWLDSLLAGAFDGAQVLGGLNAWKQQDTTFAQQLDALKEAERRIEEFLQRQWEEKSPALKQVLEKEDSRLRELIGKSSDQAASLQKRLDQIQDWLRKFDGGAAAPPDKKGGAKALA